MCLGDNLAWRGLIKDKTFGSNRWLDQPKTFYWGVDCSADSLTIGNLAPLLLARRLAEAGWKAVLLVGGATSLIGDPGGKDAERPLLAPETVTKNVSAIASQVSALFAGQKYDLTNNRDWFKDLGYLEFLRQVGKHFSITELLQRDFVAERIGEQGNGLSYAEFSYSLIQGYDYYQLYRNHNVVLQIGGSDQWGNMLSGVSLIRKLASAEVQALSMPLVVNKATGRKFGKSETGAVWLSPDKTSPTEFYQFWMNSNDDDVAEYLKVFTMLPKLEIEKILKRHNQDPQQRLAQQELAGHVTELVHGPTKRRFAESVTKYLTWELPISEADKDTMAEIRRQIPSVEVQPGTPVIEVVVKAGLASSNSDARRLVDSGGIYTSQGSLAGAHLENANFKNNRLMLRRGKAFKDSALVELI